LFDREGGTCSKALSLPLLMSKFSDCRWNNNWFPGIGDGEALLDWSSESRI